MEFLSYEFLKFAWWILIGVLWMGFAITEGFDMGVAMMVPFVGKTDDERRIAINAVAPHWDGNQVWLVLAAGAFFAAWPTVYATVFSGMYLALLLMLFSLFLRPLAFDYRSKLESPRWRNGWDWALLVSGFVPPLILGVGMGNVFLGLPFSFDEITMLSKYQGSFLGLLQPFSLLTGVLAVAMFLMQGATYLTWRSTGDVQKRAGRSSVIAGLVVFALFALGGVWMYLGMNGYAVTSEIDWAGPSNPLNKEAAMVPGAWLSNFKAMPSLWIAPVLGLATALLVASFSLIKWRVMAFVSSSLALVGIITTAGVSLFPFVFPSSIQPSHSLTMWDATSSELTLHIMFWCAMFFVPLILAYTLWGYIKLWTRHSVESIQENTHTLY